MKEKLLLLLQQFKKMWKELDGKKTYISALMLLIVTTVNSLSPHAIPKELYETLKQILELMLYGSATHGIYKTIKKK